MAGTARDGEGQYAGQASFTQGETSANTSMTRLPPITAGEIPEATSPPGSEVMRAAAGRGAGAPGKVPVPAEPAEPVKLGDPSAALRAGGYGSGEGPGQHHVDTEDGRSAHGADIPGSGLPGPDEDDDPEYHQYIPATWSNAFTSGWIHGPKDIGVMPGDPGQGGAAARSAADAAEDLLVTAINWAEIWHRQRVAAADPSFFDAALEVPAARPGRARCPAPGR